MATAHSSRHEIKRLLRDLRSRTGLVLLGAAAGAGGFLLLDSLREPADSMREGGFTLRGVYYSNCRDAFQDGRANIRRGEPGYRAALDADNDGLACEPYRGR